MFMTRSVYSLSVPQSGEQLFFISTRVGAISKSVDVNFFIKERNYDK